MAASSADSWVGTLFTDAEVLAWNEECDKIEQARERREMAAEERMQKNLLSRLVMPEDVVIWGKYKDLPRFVFKNMWEEGMGLIKTPGVKQLKLKRKVIRRRPEERWSTFWRRVKEADEEYVKAALQADPTIPRTPPSPPSPGLRCLPSSMSASSSTQ